jgi:putative ATPase
VLYMAQAPKSNATAQAIWTAMAEVKEGRTLEVPEHLRDRTGEAMRDRYATRSEPRGSGEVYRSPHDAKDGLGTTNYLPEPRRYYEPTDQGFEAEAAARLEARRRAIREAERGSQGMRP